MNKTIIFCDGSSLGNPGPGGWGVVLVRESGGGRVEELGGREDYTTNNKMELTAAINALSRVGQGESAAVHTDSSYVINGITKWVHGWKRNGWQTKQKKPVENIGLWQELLRVSEWKKIEWVHVGGHVGVAGNERADEIARGFAQGDPDEFVTTLYSGALAEYPVKNILDISHDVSKQESRTSARAHSRAKAYSYLSMIDGKIEKHATWADCEKRVRGKKAKFKKAVSHEDEQKIIAEWTKK